jgi:hypothetical protein
MVNSVFVYAFIVSKYGHSHARHFDLIFEFLSITVTYMVYMVSPLGHGFLPNETKKPS